MSSGPLQPASEYERLGVTPTSDGGTRLSERAPWDESTRPHRLASAADALLSHLPYEEHELVESLARLGFYANQMCRYSYRI